MKYLVGAGIGGLFGISVPLAYSLKETLMVEHEESPRIEDSQPVEDTPPNTIEQGALILPDNMCGYIAYDSVDPKEQAKECLEVEIPAIPAI